MSALGISRDLVAQSDAAGLLQPELTYDSIDGRIYSSIVGVDSMPTFLMSLFSADDHWMFIGSNGAVTCGRQSADLALFPYCPSDVLLASSDHAGPQTLLWVDDGRDRVFWRPFRRDDDRFEVTRSLRKNLYGSRLQFVEENQTLGIRFAYEWSMGRRFGFLRSVTLENLGSRTVQVRVCDGVQNLLPTGLGQPFLRRYSNLADAYKLAEQVPGEDLAVFTYNSLPCDRPEPSEALSCTAVWSYGIETSQTILSQSQVPAFCRDLPIEPEPVVRGRQGTYLKVWDVHLPAGGQTRWGVVADVDLDVAAVSDLRTELSDPRKREQLVRADVDETDRQLWRYAASVDGVSIGASDVQSHRHLSNSLLNIMRGGIPVAGHRIPLDEFIDHLRRRDRACAKRNSNHLRQLPQWSDRMFFLSHCRETSDLDLDRIATEYLPLTLSRRHGDPSRPWNTFQIPTRTPSGGMQVGYEGNWRDLFQNWEALSLSYPVFLQAMIHRFVNASTIDGHNPYRLHADGIDWERPDPADPWATIGYWGDHQLIYLYRLLGRYRDTFPELCREDLTTRRCVYVDLPYRLRDYSDMLVTPGDTVIFDGERDGALQDAMAQRGTDMVIARNRHGDVQRVTLFEKLLLTALVKSSNFIPDAGIWLNGQRPEWNDALNAIVGKAASVVTACHLKLFLDLLSAVVADAKAETWSLSKEVARFLKDVNEVFQELSTERRTKDCPVTRRTVMDGLQQASERYRKQVYTGWSGEFTAVPRETLAAFLCTVKQTISTTIRNNRRPDGLYNTYNWVRISENGIDVSSIELMLEGQVAVIESALLPPAEVVGLLRALRQSSLYREDQQSYLLYPDREVPPFLAKNQIRAATAAHRALVERILQTGDQSLLRRSRDGGLHFSRHLRNSGDLCQAIEQWNARSGPVRLSPADKDALCQLWEEVFQHKVFTGRATTFFGYEGLGSIYWHMVSKLILSVGRYIQELEPEDRQDREELISFFHQLNGGIWRNKAVDCYGAFPADAYSHTPAHAGVQQPGMTGQVKEDILTRSCEYGMKITDGRICFHRPFLRKDEYIDSEARFSYLDVFGEEVSLILPVDSIGFTFCQVPVIFILGSHGKGLRVTSRDGSVILRNRMELTREESASIFDRRGEIVRIDVGVDAPSDR